MRLPLRAVGVVRASLVAALLVAAIPSADAQVDPRAELAAAAAFRALEEGKVDAAAEAFREALKYDAKNARLHLGAAVTAFAQRRDEDARMSATRALALEPELHQARELLGRLYHRAGDLNAAILAFEDLKWKGHGGEALIETLERWKRDADLRNRMHLQVSSRFTIRFEGAEDATLASEALTTLEHASARIGDVLGTYPVEPIPVVLYTAEQFHDITRAPRWSAGAFDGTIRIPVKGALVDRDEFHRVLAHELTHAIVRTLASRGVPTWLNEGLAVALEHETPVAGPRITGTVSLQALSGPFARLSSSDARAAYAVSGLAVRRLLDELGGFAVANLLRDLGAGVPLAEAFLARTNRSLADFEATLLR